MRPECLVGLGAGTTSTLTTVNVVSPAGLASKMNFCAGQAARGSTPFSRLQGGRHGHGGFAVSGVTSPGVGVVSTLTNVHVAAGAVSCVYWSASMRPGSVECMGSAVEVSRDAVRRDGGGGGGPRGIGIDVDQC